MEKLQQQLPEQQKLMQEQKDDAKKERQEAASKEKELEEKVYMLPTAYSNSMPGQFA